jgi:hypothetical protein
MPRTTRLVYGDYRQVRKGEPGYSATKRRYISPSQGDIITKYEYQKLATRTTIPKKHPISKNAKLANYYDKLKRYVTHQNTLYAGVGQPITLNQARQSTHFKELYKALKSKDNSKNGPKAKALIAFGLRDANADYDVGETP